MSSGHSRTALVRLLVICATLALTAGCGSIIAYYLGEWTGQSLRSEDGNDNQTGRGTAELRTVPDQLKITDCNGVAEFKVYVKVGEEPETEISAGDGFSQQSENSSIASVIDVGRVQAVSSGETSISISFPDPNDETGASTLSATIPVSVSLPSANLFGLRTDPSTLAFANPSERGQVLVLKTFDCGPDQTASGNDGVTFESADLSIATVDANGVVAPIARGKTSIRAHAAGKTLVVPVDVTFCKPRLAQLDPVPAVTRDTAIRLTGRGEPNSKVEVFGPAANVSTVVDGAGNYAIDVSLAPNRGNMLFVTSVVEENACNNRGSSTTVNVTNDNQAPAVFIDFPLPAASLITETTDVAGRVSDLLSGYADLKVVVNGVVAEVNRGIGTNGTFFARNVPLTPGQSNTLTATATDLVGNVASESISVGQAPIDPTQPVIHMTSGNAQSAPFMGNLIDPLVVRVEKQGGIPFAGKLVTFHVTRSDVRLLPTNEFSETNHGDLTAQVRTNADGYAQVYVMVGSDAGMGNARIEATSAGVQGAVMFCASILPGPAHQINIGTGNNQRAEAGGPAPEPLRIRVSDSCNAIANQPVRYSVTRGGGKLIDPVSGAAVDSLVVNTADTGHTEVRFILGPEVGNNLVEVNFDGNPTGSATFVIYGVARRTTPATFSGLVLNNSNEPLGGAVAILKVNGVEVGRSTSTATGQFRIENIATGGKADLFIDADPINAVNNQPIAANIRYPDMHYEAFAVPNADNSLPMNVLLPPLDRVNDRQYRFDDANPLELTCEGMEGIKLIVQPHTRITLADGTVYDAANPGPLTLALNQVHHDDVPMPMPDGVAPPFAWTFQPGGAHFDVPVAIEYPNMSGLPAGAISYFLSFNHDTNKFEIIASGRVSEDGSKSVTDRGVGITTSGWGCNCPPYSVTGDCELCPEDSNSQSARRKDGARQADNEDDCCTACQSISVTGALAGDVIEIVISEPGLSEFELASADNRVAQINNWESVLRSTGKFYFLPRVDITYPATETLALTAQCGDTMSNRVNVDIIIKDIAAGHSTLPLSGAVGSGAANNRLDVYRVQHRLRYLGFPSRTGVAVERTGILGGGFEEAIRLFQATVNPSQRGGTAGNPATNSNGRIDPNSDQHLWLSAQNAPRWIELIDSGCGGDFDIFRCDTNPCVPCTAQTERFGSSWAVDSIYYVTPATTDTELITAISENGYTTGHSEHKSGMDVDVNIDAAGRVVGTGSTLTQGEQRVVDQMIAFYGASLTGTPISRIIVGYNRIVNEFNTLTGTTIAVLDSGNVHDTHFHIDYSPPTREPAATSNVAVQCSESSIPTGRHVDGHAEAWDFVIAGQSVSTDFLGAAEIRNILAPDSFGTGGPGTRPDFVSDDFLRVIGTSNDNGLTRYSFSEFFPLRQGETYIIQSLTVTNTPPRAVSRLRTRPGNGTSNVLTAIDQTLPMQTFGDLTDGTLGEDLTPATKWTTYRTSNPAVALVNTDGLVTAKGRGTAFITATNEGATSVTRVIVVPGDPLTSVEGFCQTPDGQPVAGAVVSIGGQSVTGTSNGDGYFRIDGVATTLGDLVARATAAGSSGSSAPTVPVSGRITDVGIIPMTVPNTSGRDFAMAFPTNYNNSGVTLTLFISADEAASGSVEIPGLAFQRTFDVQPGLVTSVTLPPNAVLPPGSGIRNLGVFVNANREINVYGLSRIQFTTDAFAAIPVQSAGRRYRAMCYGGSGNGSSEAVVVAIEDDTNVTIRGTTSIDVNLNRSEVYQFTSADCTGALIESDKPVTVLSGHVCANVPPGASFCDHLVEQIPPSDTWGQRVLTLPLATRLNGDTFRIVADQDNTVVQINGPQPATFTLNAGQFNERILRDNNEIIADKPILVAQYSNGGSYDGVTSDPFMCLVPPSEQFLTGYTFATPASGFPANFVNVIALTADVNAGRLFLDGNAIPQSQFQTILGSEYSCAKIAINAGSHTISSTNPLGIYVYGFADDDSYGYPGGFALRRRP